MSENTKGRVTLAGYICNLLDVENRQGVEVVDTRRNGSGTRVTIEAGIEALDKMVRELDSLQVESTNRLLDGAIALARSKFNSDQRRSMARAVETIEPELHRLQAAAGWMESVGPDGRTYYTPAPASFAEAMDKTAAALPAGDEPRNPDVGDYRPVAGISVEGFAAAMAGQAITASEFELRQRIRAAAETFIGADNERGMRRKTITVVEEGGEWSIEVFDLPADTTTTYLVSEGVEENSFRFELVSDPTPDIKPAKLALVQAAKPAKVKAFPVSTVLASQIRDDIQGTLDSQGRAIAGAKLSRDTSAQRLADTLATDPKARNIAALRAVLTRHQRAYDALTARTAQPAGPAA